MASAAATERQCYICYDKESDDPSAAWASACPCSLEAHEKCLLRWVAEQEFQKGQQAVKCSACQAPIRVIEPRDAVLQLRDRLHRAYSRVSPFVLMGFVYAGGVAGSGCYGLAMAQIFAGSGPALAWLGMPRIRRMARYMSMYRVPPFWEATAKFWALSLLGPGIVVARALPAQVRGVVLPSSIVHAAYLCLREDYPTWPPSPDWAMTLMPGVHLLYSTIYRQMFGRFERRLNKALRGQPLTEDAPGQPALGANDANDVQAARPDRDDNDGMWATAVTLWQVIFNDDDDLALDNDMHRVINADIALEVHLGGVRRDENNAVARQGVGNAALVHEEADGELVERGQPANPVNDGSDMAAAEHVVEVIEPAAAAAPEPRPAAAADAHPEQQAPAAEAADQPAAPPPAAAPNQGRDGGGVGALTEVANSLVTSALYPVIAFGAGELLRTVLPASWTIPPRRGPPTGLLQARWGRSLAGGCLFVVLRDAYTLYMKYRRVQVKMNRRIRIVQKKRGAETGSGPTTTATATTMTTTMTTTTTTTTTTGAGRAR